MSNYVLQKLSDEDKRKLDEALRKRAEALGVMDLPYDHDLSIAPPLYDLQVSSMRKGGRR